MHTLGVCVRRPISKAAQDIACLGPIIMSLPYGSPLQQNTTERVRRPGPEFGAWAELYWRFRPIYPAPVFALLSALVRDRARLCIELGAGSGQATTSLLERFERVIAIEPDAAMAKLMPHAPRLETLIVAAEEYAGPDQRADAVVAASALHWMDQSAITGRAAGWLRPGGVFMAFSYGAVQVPGAPAAVQRVLHRHAQRTRAHVDPRLSHFAPYHRSLEASGAYHGVETFELFADHRWGARELAGFLMSTSYGHAAAVSTGDATAYFQALVDELTGAYDGRALCVRFPIDGAFGLKSEV